MALSGSFNTTAYSGRYLTFSWTATQNVAANTSTISWRLVGAAQAAAIMYQEISRLLLLVRLFISLLPVLNYVSVQLQQLAQKY